MEDDHLAIFSEFLHKLRLFLNGDHGFTGLFVIHLGLTEIQGYKNSSMWFVVS